MPDYRISGTRHVYDWIAQTSESSRVDALLVWTKAVCHMPQSVATGVVENTVRRRLIHYADVPGASTRVTYQIVDVPARCVHIIDISDEMFEVDP